MHEKIGNYEALSSRLSPRPLPNSSLAQHRSNLLLLHPNRPDEHPLLPPTTQKHQPNFPGDRAGMPSGSPHVVRMEDDNSSSRRKTPRADLPSPEKDVTKHFNHYPSGGHQKNKHSPCPRAAHDEPGEAVLRGSTHLCDRAQPDHPPRRMVVSLEPILASVITTASPTAETLFQYL